MAIVSSITNHSSLPDDKGEERLVGPSPLKEELKLSQQNDSLRPRSFDDFVGQSELKKVLEISVKASLKRGEALDHLMLYGPPGL